MEPEERRLLWALEDKVERIYGTLYGREDEGQVGLVRMVREQQADEAVRKFLNRVLTFVLPPLLTVIAAFIVGRLT